MAGQHRVKLPSFLGFRLYPVNHRPAAFFALGMGIYAGFMTWVDMKYKASIAAKAHH